MTISSLTFAFILLIARVQANDGDSSPTFDPFWGSSTCSSSEPSSLAWNYKLFGNLSLKKAGNTVGEMILVADERISKAADFRSPSCLYGVCDLSSHVCKCSKNWSGSKCQNCASRTWLKDEENGLIVSNISPSYQENSRCTWLITPQLNSSKQSLQLKLVNFSTECSWDILFIYDGTSADPANLIAVISGDLSPDFLDSYPPIYSQKGSFLIYFYADAYMNDPGFTLEYTYSDCPRNCSSHGSCQRLEKVDNARESNKTSIFFKCSCETGYYGDACEFIRCPANCSNENGTCLKDGTCQCRRGFTGTDCSIDVAESSGYFNLKTAPIKGTTISNNPGAGGSAAWDKDFAYFFGGFDFSSRSDPLSMRRFDLLNQTFESLAHKGNESFANRYGHSASYRRGFVYIFGGTLTDSNRITSQLIAYNIDNRTFVLVDGDDSQRHLPNSQTSSAALTGHSAHVIQDKLYIFFGYSPDYGLSDWLRIFDFNSSQWTAFQSPFSGRAWHSSVFDAKKDYVFIYGGFAGIQKRASVDISADLLKYNVNTQQWTFIARLPSRRAFHSAIIMPDLDGLSGRFMVVHGGTMHETTSSSQRLFHESGRCVVSKPFALDLDNGCYFSLNDSALGSFRMGHSAISYEQSLLYFGGFDGSIIDNQMLIYQPLPCENRSSVDECIVANGYSCKWRCDRCYSIDKTVENCSEPLFLTFFTVDCSVKFDMNASKPNTSKPCSEKTSCLSCSLYKPDATEGCSWRSHQICDEIYSTTTSTSTTTTTTSDTMLTSDEHDFFETPQNFTFEETTTLEDTNGVNDDGSIDFCPVSCDSLNDCGSCLKQPSCLWCNTLSLCLSSEAYRISFPYGQCQDWTMAPSTCRSNCSAYKSCSECQQDLRCGWCDDGSNTGTGNCLAGGLNEPKGNTDNSTQCPNDRWNFAECPLCQCSGHSTCLNGTSKCLNCEDNTEGEKCEKCASGYFGNALNGGICNRKLFFVIGFIDG